jgi:hypothetical protein
VTLPADDLSSVANYSTTKAASEYQTNLKILFRMAQENFIVVDGDVSYDDDRMVHAGGRIVFTPVDKRIASDGYINANFRRLSDGQVISGLGGAPDVPCSRGSFRLPEFTSIILRQNPGGRYDDNVFYAVSMSSAADVLQPNDLIVFAYSPDGVLIGGRILLPIDRSYSSLLAALSYDGQTTLADATAASTLPSSGAATTILQTVRNCLKWLVGKFSSHVHNGTDSSTIAYSALTGTPTIPAKTTLTPLANGTAAIGNDAGFAAGNHVHGTDTSRAPVDSPTFTGTVTLPDDDISSVANDSTGKAASEYQATLKTLSRMAQTNCIVEYGDVYCGGSGSNRVCWTGRITFVPVDIRTACYGYIYADSPRFPTGTVIPGLGGAPSVTCYAPAEFVLPEWTSIIVRHKPGGDQYDSSFYVVGINPAYGALQPNDLILFTYAPDGVLIGGRIFLPRSMHYSSLMTSLRIAQLAGDMTVQSLANGNVEATLAASGVTAGSYGSSTTRTLGFGESFAVPRATVDAKGRVTAASEATLTLPSVTPIANGGTGETTQMAARQAMGGVIPTTNPGTPAAGFASIYWSA